MNKYSILFEPRIWGRGEKYFREKRVQNVQVNNGIYSAIVKGTNNYKVTVNTNTMEMKCGCLYAADLNNCKHMAALCLYVQSKTESKTKTNKPKYSWEPFFFIKNGEIYGNHWQMPDKISNYLKHKYTEFKISESEYFEDLLALLDQMSDVFYYGTDRIFIMLVNAISDIRIYTNDQNKKKYDALVKKRIKKYNDDIVELFIEKYYKCKGDYKIIQEILEKRFHLRYLISAVVENMKEYGEDEILIEDICIKNIEFDYCRIWLQNYYIYNGLNERGIEVFEGLLDDYQLNKQMKIAIQTTILDFYANIQPIYPEHPVFVELMKTNTPDKTEILLTMKNSMSEEEWLKIGKPYVRKWALNKSSDTYLRTLKELDAGDIIIEKLNEIYLNFSFLREFAQVIYDYDPGILYDLYYETLKNNSFNYHPSSFITEEIQKLDTDSVKLKTMLYELSKEVEKPYLLERITILEDDIYGEE